MTIEQTLLENALRDPKSPMRTFELPGGYLEETEAGPVLHREVDLKEMTGDEEDLLAKRDLAHDVKMNALIASCITRLGTIEDKRKIRAAVPDLPIGDRTFLFFAMRRVSLGDEFPFREACPNCEEISLYPYDLGQMSVQAMEDPMKRAYSVTLPSGKVVEFKTLTGADEKRRKKWAKTIPAKTLALLLRVTAIDGVTQIDQFKLKQLSMRDRDALRAAFARVDGGVETVIELTCPLCGADFTREIDPGQPSFFSPSEMSEIWKRRSST